MDRYFLVYRVSEAHRRASLERQEKYKKVEQSKKTQSVKTETVTNQKTNQQTNQKTNQKTYQVKTNKNFENDFSDWIYTYFDV